jgi:tyrosyl-DNA phosphodiesterase-1
LPLRNIADDDRAMKASMAEEVSEEPDLSGPGNTSGSTDTSVAIATPAETAPTLPPVLSGRAQMEQERIARQTAREGQTSNSQPSASTTSDVKPTPSTGSRIATMADLSRNAEAGPSSNTSRATNGSKSTTRPPTYHPLQSTGPFPTDAAGEYYLDGEMRHNALTIGRNTSAPTFSPQQIVGKVSCQSLFIVGDTDQQKSEISLLIMCSFVIDDEWLNTILPPPQLVPTILIRPHDKEKNPGHNGKCQVQDNQEVWCYPRMMGAFG